MATSRACLYLGMCVAAALASFLAGFMAGKCAPLPGAGWRCALPRWGARRESLEGCVGFPEPRALQLRGVQPTWKPNGMHLTFLMRCD